MLSIANRVARLEGCAHCEIGPRSRVWSSFFAGLIFVVCAPLNRSEAATAQLPEEVSFSAIDDVKVFGDLYVAGEDRSAPIVLLFHQSASNTREYFPIAPRLTALGYHALAIDARGGGHRRGGRNRTVARLAEPGGGREAYHDFKAALAYVREAGFRGPIVLWGSSYSAGRLFQVLAEQPEGVVAALSFSPGAAFARRQPDGSAAWAEQVQIPIFMTWAESELDADRRGRFARVAAAEKVLFEQHGGVHGASTLHADRNPDGYEAVWEAVFAFLAEYVDR